LESVNSNKKMKKTLLFVVLTIISILLPNCNNDRTKSNGNLLTIKVSDNNMRGKIKFSEVIKDYQFIPFETTNESIIGQIDKIMFHNNQYFVLDNLKTMSILVFASDGKFLWKLSKMGHGPGEYIELVDFNFDPLTQSLVVLSMKDLIFYDSKTGFYIKTIKLPARGWKFDFPDENHISIVDAGNGDNLFITDSNGTRETSYFKFVKETKLLLNQPFLRNGKSELLYINNLDYTIYKISGNQIIPHLRIDFHKDMYTPDNLGLLKENKSNANNFYRIRNYFESKNKILAQCQYKRISYWLISDTKSQKTFMVNYYDIENDITYTKFLPRIVSNDSDDNFISFIEANNLINGMANNIDPDSKIKRIVDNLKPTDNPILVLFKLQ
jgi:hypothetical protein